MQPQKPNNAKQSQPSVGQVLPHKFEPQPFQNFWSYDIKNYHIGVPLNGIIFLPNLIKIYQEFQELIGWVRQTDGDLISLFTFLESRLKRIFLSKIYTKMDSNIKNYSPCLGKHFSEHHQNMQ
jgi:hypothetical protein